MRVDESRVTAAYMLASARHGTIYLGSTLDLMKRMHEHANAQRGFTARYGVRRLVWYERFLLLTEARAREYELKKWRRDWKVNLIERDNPHWDDLFPAVSGAILPTRVIREAKVGDRCIETVIPPVPGLGEAQVRGPLSQHNKSER